MIVLIVIPAMDDLGNKEAIQIVKDADAEDRCIGVVTKCDLVPENPNKTDVLAKLRMKRDSDIVLGEGLIAVLNRAVDEMESSLDEADQKELLLFQKHPVLSLLKKMSGGTEHSPTKSWHTKAESYANGYQRSKSPFATR